MTSLTLGKKALAGVATLAAGGSATYIFADEQSKQAAKLTARSYYRIANFLSTVGYMTTDYAYHIYFEAKDSTDNLASQQRLLRRLQDEQESHTLKLLQCQSEHKDGSFWQRRIVDNRISMNDLSTEIAMLEEKSVDDFGKLHLRNAKRMRDMCAENGGLYIKLGQHIAMLDYAVPNEYQQVLTSLLATTPQTSPEAVRRVIRRELGADPEKLFDSFQEQPIASASLAQVHVAYKDGQKLAVKIQHEGLKESAFTDMWVITKIVSFIPNIFPEFNYDWLTVEMNKNVPRELNFLEEKENIHKCTRNLKRFIERGEVVVPKTYDAYCTAHMLTMSFEEGHYVNNLEQLQRAGINKVEVAALISKVFWTQIFESGFVHCDPHEANVLVRKSASGSGKPQIVLLDHGLYRELNDQFRRDYCRLWQGLVLSDEARIERYCHRMNAGSAYTLLAAIITQRPWDDIVSDDIDRLHGKKDAGDAVMLRSYAQRYFKEINQLLGTVPSEMLLLFKTSDCLRHLDKMLGAPVNTAAVAADMVSDVIVKEDLCDAWNEYVSASPPTTSTSSTSTLVATATTTWSFLSKIWTALTEWSTLKTRVSLLNIWSFVYQLTTTGSNRDTSRSLL